MEESPMVNAEETSDGWTGKIIQTAQGLEKFVIVMGQFTDALPFGSAVSIVVSHIQEARELQRLAQVKEETIIASIRRTEKTLQQLEENQVSDQSKHRPVQNLLSEYAKLLGNVDNLCKAWNRCNCMQQMCYSSRYNDQFDDLTQDMAALKADLTLSTIAKVDAEARVHAQQTQSAIVSADQAAQGRFEETKMQLNEAAMVQEETRSHILDLKELVENSVTTNAMTLEMTQEWDSIMRFDWTAKSIGVVTDACRAVVVGLVEPKDSPHQLLLLQFFDTEEQYEYGKSSRSGGRIISSQRPTWAMTMKAQEMKTVRTAFRKQQ